MVILNLGTLEGLNPSKHKMLADRIEELLTSSKSLFAHHDPQVEKLARHYAKTIIKQGAFSLKPKAAKKTEERDAGRQYVEADLNSAEEIESRSLGGEWFAKQAFEKLSLDEIFASLVNNGDAISRRIQTKTARVSTAIITGIFCKRKLRSIS